MPYVGEAEICAVNHRTHRSLQLRRRRAAPLATMVERPLRVRASSSPPATLLPAPAVPRLTGRVRRSAGATRKKPGIFDCDSGLVGKVSWPAQFAFPRRAYLIPAERDHPSRDAFAQYRNAKNGTVVAHPCVDLAPLPEGRIQDRPRRRECAPPAIRACSATDVAPLGLIGSSARA